MSMPPLPQKDIDNADCQSGHSDEQMQTDRKQVRDAALEDAAQVSERGFQYGHDGNAIADAIRSLK